MPFGVGALLQSDRSSHVLSARAAFQLASAHLRSHLNASQVLISQLTQLALADKDSPLVPLPLRISELQRTLLASREEVDRLVEEQRIEFAQLASRQQQQRELVAPSDDAPGASPPPMELERRHGAVAQPDSAQFASQQGEAHAPSQASVHTSTREALDRAHAQERAELGAEHARRLRMAHQRSTFATAFNWVDAHLREVHGASSAIYRMLRQALMARRALLLLDGVDEAGLARAESTCRAHTCQRMHVMACAREASRGMGRRGGDAAWTRPDSPPPCKHGEGMRPAPTPY